eukprot:5476521-Pleurochrysis_carterae.AAC.1
MNLAHDEKYAGHPILRLFTRPTEMENGMFIRIAKEDVAQMNSASTSKKLTYDTLNPRMGQKTGEPRTGGKRNGIGNHIRGVARTGLGHDT